MNRFMRVGCRRAAPWLSLAGLAVAVGCGFPSVTYDTAADGGEDAGGSGPGTGAARGSPAIAGESSGAGSVDHLPSADGASADSAAAFTSDGSLTTSNSVSSIGAGSANSSSEPGRDPSSGSSAGSGGPGAPRDDATASPVGSAPDATTGTGGPGVMEASGGGGPADVVPIGKDSAPASRDATALTPDTGAPGPDATTTKCDVDGDGYVASGSACAGKTGDCDDSDPKANPGVKDFVTAVPTATTKGDWNCDGTVEKQYPVVDCTLVGVASCDATAGFLVLPGTAPPECGASGSFVQCVAIGKGNNGNGALKLCVAGTTTAMVQGCR